ncbi:helix-turn-helix domain-containing protein [Halogeometricum luteum]|uniref:TrmB family transcriptional regulator n=1 Tax=Halogeometricum luteum TaxID=2950537 RepID=A0ABU2G4W0_9EURY|nr:helix-turn-helix domain-containing protein [Halogeometricum sp. S3BR5-2]MDS0295254.1 TrmB family transcriptional regulator [Halogeometricum sp. S3BR5-2]
MTDRDTSSETQRTDDAPPRRDPTLPAELRSAETKLVYLYVRQTGGCTPAELCESLQLTKLSVLPLLRSLRERELVRREADRYVPDD